MLRLLRKPVLYLDTSVPSAYYDDAHPERQAATVAFWGNLRAYQPRLSALVIQELLHTDDADRRHALLQLVTGIPKLRVTSEAVELAELYVEEGLVPDEFTDDAVHLAVATVHGVDYVVSWNYEHLVNVRTQRQLDSINLKCGYRTVAIVTPPELLTEVSTP